MTGLGLLEGRIGIVTGAGRGIGAAVARRFAEHGATVFVADIDAVGARSVAESIAATGASVEPVEDVLQRMSENSLSVMPVVERDSERFLGAVTSNDIIQLMTMDTMDESRSPRGPVKT